MSALPTHRHLVIRQVSLSAQFRSYRDCLSERSCACKGTRRVQSYVHDSAEQGHVVVQNSLAAVPNTWLAKTLAIALCLTQLQAAPCWAYAYDITQSPAGTAECDRLAQYKHLPHLHA